MAGMRGCGGGAVGGFGQGRAYAGLCEGEGGCWGLVGGFLEGELADWDGFPFLFFCILQKQCDGASRLLAWCRMNPGDYPAGFVGQDPSR